MTTSPVAPVPRGASSDVPRILCSSWPLGIALRCAGGPGWRREGGLDESHSLGVDVGLQDRSPQATYPVQYDVHLPLAVQDKEGGRPRPHQPLHVPDEVVADAGRGRGYT